MPNQSSLGSLKKRMKVSLTKISGTKWIPPYYGEASDPPRVGERFRINVRAWVTGEQFEFVTSEVKQITGRGNFRTSTGSWYRFEIQPRILN